MLKSVKVISILSLLFLVSPIAFSQHTLTIEINQLTSNKGQVIMEFCNSKGEKISGIIQSVENNNKCIIIIKDLKPDSYSFKYFHDENMNKEMDTNFIGIPKEGFGFSNNAKAKFGAPDLVETIFEIKESSKLTCSPTYF